MEWKNLCARSIEIDLLERLYIFKIDFKSNNNMSWRISTKEALATNPYIDSTTSKHHVWEWFKIVSLTTTKPNIILRKIDNVWLHVVYVYSINQKYELFKYKNKPL